MFYLLTSTYCDTKYRNSYKRARELTWRSINSEVHDGDRLFSVDGDEQRQQLKDLNENAAVSGEMVAFDLVRQQVEVVVVQLLYA